MFEVLYENGRWYYTGVPALPIEVFERGMGYPQPVVCMRVYWWPTMGGGSHLERLGKARRRARMLIDALVDNEQRAWE